MTVFYRMCNIPSTNPSPILQEDKLGLNTLCLKSFVTAFKDVKPKEIFICDYCPQEYEDIIKKICPFELEIIFTNLGINGTALKQYELAEQVDDDIILFQECDYVYRPSVGTKMVEAIKHFGLLSPYDHPDYYNRYDIHPKETELFIFNNEHFRRTKRTTMTFGMTKEVFMDSREILDKYGYLDNEVWTELATHGHKLYTPIPSYATHMVADYLSPAIPWDILFKLYE